MEKQPPKYALRFLRWFCREDYLEEIEGDLVELFERHYERSPRGAQRNFWWQVLWHFRPDFIKSFKTNPQIHSGMLQNYLKIAWRQLLKQKLYSIINVLGLTLGMACFLMLLLYVQDEWSYDRYHPKIDRMYRLHTDIKSGETYDVTIKSPATLKTTLQNDFAEVETAFRFYQRWPMWIEYEEKKLLEEKLIYADAELFDVFGLKLVKGNAKTALNSPNSIVLSETVAEKYFGAEEPIGKTLIVNNEEPYLVTGIVKEVPKNTHFDFNVFMAMPDYADNPERFGWGVNDFITYVVLKEGASPKALEEKIAGHLTKWFPDILLAGKPVPYETFADAGNFVQYSLMAVKDIHLHSHRKNELMANGDILYVRMFLIIGLFILVLACVNFANLTTARSVIRAKEVGIRKTIGARRSGLIYQFLGESSLVTAVGFILAIGALYVAMPWFNQLSGKAIAVPDFYTPSNVLLLLGIGLFTAILAGIYPAFVLSSFRPTQALKGMVGKRMSGSEFRNGLVVFQFLVTVGLIAGTIIVSQQMHFLQNQNLGFESDQIYVLYDVNQAGEQREVLQQEINQFPEVINSTMTVFFPTESHEIQQLPLFEGTTMGEGRNVLCQLWNVDENYVPTFELEVLQGRNFSPEMGLESNAVILNETAAKKFGFDNAVDKQISFGNGEQIFTFNVVGVVEDFHFESFRYEIKPVMLFYRPVNIHLAIRVQTNAWEGFIGKLQDKYREFAVDHPFLGDFLNERFANRYDAEIRLAAVIRVFTALALFLATVGLFGLATYVAQQRTKEIGIRKIFGASMTSVVVLLSKDFLRLVGIAIFIAIPIAWYFCSQWLHNFAYRIEIRWWVFGLAGMIALGIAFFTVLLQSMKAASMNPVKAMRDE